MSHEFKLIRDYWEERNIYKKSKITLNSGVTILVSCNGSGKTTLFSQMKTQLENEGIKVLHFDNYKTGGHRGIQSLAVRSDEGSMYEAMGMMMSSEGETIYRFIGGIAQQVGRLARSLTPEDKEAFVLLDGIDSGLSIDNIVEVKDVFKLMMNDYKSRGCDLYIVVSANEYELARNEQCFDVISGKYITFNDYDEYRDFILESRRLKNESTDKYYNKQKRKDSPFNDVISKKKDLKK